MSLALACQILTQRTSVESQPSVDGSSCIMAFDRGLNLEMAKAPHKAGLQLKAHIGAMPEEEEARGNLMRKSLLLNLKRLRVQAASLALDETKSILFLWQLIASPVPSQEEIFCEEVETFLNHVDFWRSRSLFAPKATGVPPEMP